MFRLAGAGAGQGLYQPALGPVLQPDLAMAHIGQDGNFCFTHMTLDAHTLPAVPCFPA